MAARTQKQTVVTPQGAFGQPPIVVAQAQAVDAPDHLAQVVCIRQNAIPGVYCYFDRLRLWLGLWLVRVRVRIRVRVRWGWD